MPLAPIVVVILSCRKRVRLELAGPMKSSRFRIRVITSPSTSSFAAVIMLLGKLDQISRRTVLYQPKRRPRWA
jgi:hypothetical protein